MSLRLQPNVRADIHRGANPASPYPAGEPEFSVDGYLKADPAGRHGEALWLKWTHVLLLPPDADVRDAYAGQLDPARDDTLADTVVVHSGEERTAWYVVFVAVADWGGPSHHLRVYLDRFAPAGWPTDAL